MLQRGERHSFFFFSIFSCWTDKGGKRRLMVFQRHSCRFLCKRAIVLVVKVVVHAPTGLRMLVCVRACGSMLLLKNDASVRKRLVNLQLYRSFVTVFLQVCR